MRRVGKLIVLVLAFGVAGSVGIIAAGAQDATPPSVIEIAPGVTADHVVIFEGRQDPSLYRLHFAPGTTYAVQPGQSLELIYVEDGALTLSLDQPFMRGTIGTPGATELIQPNTEVTLEAGTYFVIQPGTGGTARNDGQEEAVVSVAGVLPGGFDATPAA